MASSKKSGMAKQLPKMLTYGAILIALFYIVFVWGNITIKQLLPIKYAEQVNKYSQEYMLDPYLVYAIINTESHFNSAAKSNAGAIGLMQLMPDTATWLAGKYKIDYTGEQQLSDPDKNIQLGCQYYSYLLNKFNSDNNLALAAYNGGETNVANWLLNSEYSADGKSLKKIPYKETSQYVTKVTVSYDIYVKIYKNK